MGSRRGAREIETLGLLESVESIFDILEPYNPSGLVLAEEEFGLKDQAPGADLTFELFVRGENPLEMLGLLEFERVKC